jgi:LETM1-like protein
MCRSIRKTSHLCNSSWRNQGLQLSTTTRRHSLICGAASSSSSGGALDSPSGPNNGSAAYSTANSISDTTAKAARRSARLQSALLLRKLYRNLLRAEPLLQLPSPVYQPPEETPAASISSATAVVLNSDNATSMDLAAAAAAAAAQLQAQLEERIEEAVVLVAEMELTAEELRLGLRALKSQPERYGLLFSNSKNTSSDPGELENQIQSRVKDVYSQLMDRVSKEITELPFPSISVAQAALDARNARFRALGLPPALESIGDGDGAPEGGYYLAAEARRGLGERLGEAERVAERFLARRLQPAVARVRETSPEGLIEGVQKSATWARGLWDRLNGSAYDGASSAAPSGLPLPLTLESDGAAAVDALHGEIEELEKKLQEASKARETRLRKAGIQGRARMAAELRQMDNEVAAVSRALAVRTLQLEMEYIYGCLEGEVIDILGDPSAAAAAAQQEGASTSSTFSSVALALSRRGSTDEVALLAAEFRQLDAELAAMASEVEAGGALYIDDGDIAALATEIPDLRLRLGVGDTTVFGGSGLSLSKMQMQIRQAVSTITEAVNFGTRGVRLLGSDAGAAGRLFWRALLGGTLKPREVAALRRTARDLLTFIPFAIILILPLTPVGHVLIFGFIQRYFPGFFPSQFTNRRQDLMVKYEQLTKQLQEAQVAAEAESDELEFRKAAAKAVAEAQRRSGSMSGSLGGSMGSSGSGSTSSSDVDVASGVIGNVDGGGTMDAGGGGSTTTDVNAAGGALGGVGDGIVGGGVPSIAAGEDDETEGPAAKAVRKLQEEIAAAADTTYTGTLDLE